MCNQIGGCFVQHNTYIKYIINVYRQHVSAFSVSQHQAKYKMCTYTHTHTHTRAHARMHARTHACLFYAKVMNKNVKCWRVGTCQHFFKMTYNEALLLDSIVMGNKL